MKTPTECIPLAPLDTSKRLFEVFAYILKESSNAYSKGITVFKIFIWGGISSAIRKFSFTATRERSRKT